jgi:uncharacterized membrane protein
MSDAQWLGILAVLVGLCPWLMRGFAEDRTYQFYFTDLLMGLGASPLMAAVILYLASLVFIVCGIAVFVKATRRTQE